MPLVVVERENEKEALDFWQQHTPEERVSAVEFLREQYYVICGYTTIPRISRRLRLIDHSK